MDSNTSLTVRQMPSENHSAFNPQFRGMSPQSTNIDFRQITKDQSVTKLLSDTLILDHAISNDKMPTAAAALAGAPISPGSNNTLSYLPTQASSNQVQLKTKLKRSPQKAASAQQRETGKASKGEQNSNSLYAMDLGTMGIPREVARLNQQGNFLYTSSNPLGPGEYQ